MRLILSKEEANQFNRSDEYKKEIHDECKKMFERGISSIDLYIENAKKPFKRISLSFKGEIEERNPELY